MAYYDVVYADGSTPRRASAEVRAIVTARLPFLLAAALAIPGSAGAAQPKNDVQLDGYAEWRLGPVLIVDGQRVKASSELKFKGHGGVKSFAAIPLGYEVKVKGIRLLDGTVLAREAEAKPNGEALFEGELKSAFDQMERQFREEGRVYEEDEDGKRENYGRLIEEGPLVARVDAIVDDLVPPSAKRDGFRVYVVRNEEWNAMAGPNGAIFVFTGLLEAMDDDEVAIILGHELAHATHEHSRRHFKKDLLVQLAAAGIVLAAEEIVEGDVKKVAIQAAALLGANAWTNGYGRGYEDQADRVGLRYAYEGGYDVAKGPRLWQRFKEKYGELPKLLNFFFSDHSMHKARAENLEREIRTNYREAEDPA